MRDPAAAAGSLRTCEPGVSIELDVQVDVINATSSGNGTHTIEQLAPLNVPSMINTLCVNFRDPMRRRYVAARLGGKMIGITLVMARHLWPVVVLQYPGRRIRGSVKRRPEATDVINPLNTVWVLVTAFLVFFMQAGFMMLEGGFARTREVSNIMIECIVDTGLCGIIFYAFGFAFMFGPGNGVDRVPLLLPAGCAAHVRHDRHRVHGVLAVPVRVRRHGEHDRVGRDGRAHRVQGRPLLQHHGERLHLPDLRPLDLGSERLARDDGHAVP